MKKFYDTSSLLLEEEFKDKIYISSITLFELEEIKSSIRKSDEVRAAARKLLHHFDNGTINYETIVFNNHMLKPITKTGVDITNDMKILATALYYERTFAPDDMIFYTNDLALKTIANLFLGTDSIKSVIIKPDNYTGYLDLKFTNEALVYLYEHLDENIYNLNINQYLIVRDFDNNIVDKMCWTGMSLRPVKYYNFSSHWFGEVKPKSGDIY